MQQSKFDNTYRALLRRWTQLGKQETRTWREQQEYEAADRYLSAREACPEAPLSVAEGPVEWVGTVRELTSDYDQLMKMGDLGGTEL